MLTPLYFYRESPRLPRSSVCSRHSKHSGSRLFPTPDELFETKRKSGNWEPAPIISERNRSVTEAGIEKPDDSEVFVRSSTLRMSYQQATGHVTLLSDDENDIPLHHHRYILWTTLNHSYLFRIGLVV